MRLSKKYIPLLIIFIFISLSCSKQNLDSVTVPVKFDHNRMLVEAEIQTKDGSWREILLWVDTGNPNFFISESLGEDLGIDLSTAHEEGFDVVYSNDTQINLRIGDMELDFSSPRKKVVVNPKWLFTTMHIDANLPSTVLMKYDIVFDYPGKTMTIAKPGTLKHQGERVDAKINTETGIVQIDGEDGLSFALDNGASFSFFSEKAFNNLEQRFPFMPCVKGATGCANIWGWWSQEESWNVCRISSIKWGGTNFSKVGIVVLPDEFPIFDDYSKKSALPIDGFIGPNAFNSYRVEIDYVNNLVYFEKILADQVSDFDIVGITLRPELDGNYSVLGVVTKNGEPVLSGINNGDTLITIDEMEVKGKTMGKVVDALRGMPGDKRIIKLKRNEKVLEVECEVKRLL